MTEFTCFNGYDVALYYEDDGTHNSGCPETAFYISLPVPPPKDIELTPLYVTHRAQPIKGAYEWCLESGIDPENMSEDEIMAFKLKFL